MTNLELVRAVRSLFGGKPERWTQGCNARRADGAPARTPESAVCWCLDGALWEVGARRDGDDDEHRAFADALGFEGDAYLAMVIWNDRTERTFADVDARLAEAEQRLSAEHTP